jgi:Protein of unknown function (DUF3050)
MGFFSGIKNFFDRKLGRSRLGAHAGREDLLPSVFQRIVDELNVEAGGGREDFKYYLNRHIGLDSDEHGPMANRLLLSLCGADESRWQVAEQAAVDSLDPGEGYGTESMTRYGGKRTRARRTSQRRGNKGRVVPF